MVPGQGGGPSHPWEPVFRFHLPSLSYPSVTVDFTLKSPCWAGLCA